MNCIIPFDDPIDTRYILVGSCQTISSVHLNVYCHDAIHFIDKIIEISRSAFEVILPFLL